MRRWAIWTLAGFLLLPFARAEGSAKDASVHVIRHDLNVTLVPSAHRLTAIDRVMFQSTKDQKQIPVHLNKKLVVAGISQDGHLLAFHPRPLSASASGNPAEPDPRLVHEIVIELNRPARAGETFTLDFDYGGEINDPPKEPRHLRFVTPSDTSGYIGDEGIYIGPETAWYPDVSHSLASYRVRVTTPPKWEAVGQGKLVSRETTPTATITIWDTAATAEGVTVTSGQYVVTTRQCDTMETATYLYPDDSNLADLYLTSACQYLRSYSRLLGAYPFPRFSVVENFFASGLGMPSYTLLGAGSIRRRYIQPYALGHEIVHSWIGNYVYNDDGGNWVEGLTTYLANYYWYELEGELEKARGERRMMLMTYAVYVPPDQDYPIARFKHKADQRDSAIGYSKAAMVFHMLRREIGDERFFAAIKQLITQYGGRRASWKDLEAVFSVMASRDLRAFFNRWTEQSGALDLPPSSDPDYHLFRRIPRQDLPAMLNLFVTDPQKLVVLPGKRNAEETYQPIAERVATQEGVEIRTVHDLDVASLKASSVLFLGGPETEKTFEWARRGLPDGVQLSADRFRVGGKEYEGKAMAVLLSFRNPDDPAHVVSVFYGLSPEAAKPVAPLLFYYGWNTYVVFENGKVIARSDDDPRQH